MVKLFFKDEKHVELYIILNKFSRFIVLNTLTVAYFIFNLTFNCKMYIWVLDIELSQVSDTECRASLLTDNGLLKLGDAH